MTVGREKYTRDRRRDVAACVGIVVGLSMFFLLTSSAPSMSDLLVALVSGIVGLSLSFLLLRLLNARRHRTRWHGIRR
jgi:hypothetical protein